MDSGESIQGDVQLLSVGYMLIIAYVAIMLGKFTRLNIKVRCGKPLNVVTIIVHENS